MAGLMKLGLCKSNLVKRKGLIKGKGLIKVYNLLFGYYQYVILGKSNEIQPDGSGGWEYSNYGTGDVALKLIETIGATFDGTSSLRGSELVGEIVISYEGDTEPIILSDTITPLAGFLNSFTLGNGIKYNLKDSYGDVIYGTDDGITDYVKTSENGIHISNDGETNSNILQSLVDANKKILFDIVGIYEVNQTLQLDSNRTIDFNGSTLKKVSFNGKSPRYPIINKGAFTKTYNENINIYNLKIDVNGINIGNDVTAIIGLVGNISMFYIKYFTLCNLEILNIEGTYTGVHICNFEHFLINTIHLEGLKDGIHLGRGKYFNIKNGTFKTADDCIALNAADYVEYNPELGDIQYGLIEDCEDLVNGIGGTQFCRCLVGSWLDWFSTMDIQNGDTVVSNGRMYRAKNDPDGIHYESLTQPTHTSGIVTHEGINWLMTQDTDIVYSANVKNIDFKNITLSQDKSSGFAWLIDNTVNVRTYYPNAVPPTIDDISFDNIQQVGELTYFIIIVAPHNELNINNSTINAKLFVFDGRIDGLTYNTFDWNLIGNTYNQEDGDDLILNDAMPINLDLYRSIKTNEDWYPVIFPTINVIQCDIC